MGLAGRFHRRTSLFGITGPYSPVLSRTAHTRVLVLEERTAPEPTEAHGAAYEQQNNTRQAYDSDGSRV